MGQRFVACDREQSFLMPPDVRGWLSEGHLAWLVLEAVGEMNLEGFYAAYRWDGRSRPAYDPAMMVALLLYAYARGTRSSRHIERACEEDVAFRVPAAQLRPDHATIARFVDRHQEAIAGLFGEVLSLCAKQGLASVGVIAVDGTKLAGNASRNANVDYEQLAREILEEAQAVDAAEDELYRSTIHAFACRALGIRHLRRRPYRPRTNGKAERFIRTLLARWACGAIYGSGRERTAALDGWLWTYNHRRPHGALSHKPPIARLDELNNLPGSYIKGRPAKQRISSRQRDRGDAPHHEHRAEPAVAVDALVQHDGGERRGDDDARLADRRDRRRRGVHEGGEGEGVGAEHAEAGHDRRPAHLGRQRVRAPQHGGRREVDHRRRREYELEVRHRRGVRERGVVDERVAGDARRDRQAEGGAAAVARRPPHEQDAAGDEQHAGGRADRERRAQGGNADRQHDHRRRAARDRIDDAERRALVGRRQ